MVKLLKVVDIGLVIGGLLIVAAGVMLVRVGGAQLGWPAIVVGFLFSLLSLYTFIKIDRISKQNIKGKVKCLKL